MMLFKDILKQELLKGLPGTEVQWALASSDRMVRDFPREPGSDSAKAAVLILLYPLNGSIHTVFIQRTDYDGVHGGQISFPGGKQEKGDPDLSSTAVREASEETGIDPEHLEITGILTPLFIPVSNIVVTPVVAWTDRRPDFRLQESEVRFVIEADIAGFLDYSIVKTKPWDIRGKALNIRYFDYNGHVIWGATAMIFHELLAVINRADLSPAV
jgi:8-oxo-dGTP pyrophosphatase MutT (NUDIX family)